MAYSLPLKRAILLSYLVLSGSPLVLAHPGVSAALDYYDHQIEKSLQNQALYIQRGIIYSNDGQYQKAEADFSRAAELGDPVVVSYDLGVLHYRKKEFDTAKRYFNAYLKRFPDHTKCLEYRARLLRDARDFDAALNDLRRVFALEQRPNPGLYFSAAQMLQSSGGDGIQKALNLIDEANLKLGLMPQLQRYAIDLEIQRNAPIKAIERLQTLKPMLGKSPEWKVEMGELLLNLGRNDEAKQYFREAAEQLDTLRPTPARQHLLLKAESHLKTLAANPN